jgi:hypothetical protein
MKPVFPRLLTSLPHRKFFLLFGLLLGITILVFSQDKITDGPYAFYSDGKILVKSLVNNKLKQNSFSIDQAAQNPVLVQFQDHSKWNFSVQIRNEEKNEPASFAAVSKLLVLSDIEGEFEPFRNLLLEAKVIDKDYNWIFDTGHLVICGDLFDRGEEVAQYLWLLYKLDGEAKTKGGYVHVILGNHDIMNLYGDFRYVEPKYFEVAKLMETNYGEFYTAGTVLGKWLRTKNIIEKIGNLLCLHAGISPEVNNLALSIEEINNLARGNYDNAKMDFTDNNISVLFGGHTSPFWYRGYYVSPQAPLSQIDSTLTKFGVQHIITGHTIIADTISTHYNGKVFNVDLQLHKDNRKAEAILILDKQFYRINEKGKRKFLLQDF